MQPLITRRHALALGLSSLAAGAGPQALWAQGKYPDRPIRLIVPRAAGGPLDVVARQWAEKVKSSLGTVLIENMGGGGGTIGTAAVARAQPDGHTLALSSTSDLVLNPMLMSNCPFNAATDFAAIAILVHSTGAIVVNSAVPAKSLREFVAYAKANPGKLSYGSAGAGTMSNLTGELFKQLAGVTDIVHIPYKGSSPGLTDLVSGHIPMMALNLSDQAIELHKSGKIRILAVASGQRVAALPEVPTGSEEGYPAFVAQLFLGLFAPAGTPAPIIEQISQTTQQVMGDKAFLERLTDQGLEPVIGSTPATATKYVTDEIARWRPVLSAAGMKAG